MKKKLLVVGAHSGDFVWRAAGTIAKALEEGAETLVIAMSYGERGESGELWKEDRLCTGRRRDCCQLFGLLRSRVLG